ncbi:piggyBac transposable element-derived protein 4 [Trichonephila clavipes]|nr:piggyBac transposable element-derived protein 4 [Trichonephila clavipes]
MRARADCNPPSIRDHWALRCMSRCLDQVVSLKRDPQCLSPQARLGTHLSTHCSKDERLNRPFPAWNRTRACGVEARYATTRPLGLHLHDLTTNLPTAASEQRNRSLDQITFRIALPCQLIHGYSSGRPSSFQAKKCVVPDDVRLASVGNHLPKMVSNYRRCRKINCINSPGITTVMVVTLGNSLLCVNPGHHFGGEKLDVHQLSTRKVASGFLTTTERQRRVCSQNHSTTVKRFYLRPLPPTKSKDSPLAAF